MYHIPTPEELRKLRKDANLTQKELADLAHVSQSLIARIEKRGVDPRVSTLRKILNALIQVKENRQKIIDFATKNVIKISPQKNLSDAAMIINEKGISQLVVIDKNNKIIGSLREKSLTQKLLEYGNSILNEKIENHLNESFPEISVSTPLDEIKSLLLDNDALILINKGDLAGIVTKADIIKFYQT